jgi:uncharacterized membrane protein
MASAARKDWPNSLFWAGLLLISAPIGVYALRYWSGDPALLPFELRVNLVHNPPAFVLHTTFGGLALLLAPSQFVTRLRVRRPRLHRWIGRIYVGCCLVSGLAAYPVAFGTIAGPIATAGFSLMATAWLATTAIAFVAAWRRNFAAHRRWMVRSFALSLSAVTLRVALLVPIYWPIPFMPFYRSTSWLSWIVNLILAELWLRRADRKRPQLVRRDGSQEMAGAGTLSQTSSGRV